LGMQTSARRRSILTSQEIVCAKSTANSTLALNPLQKAELSQAESKRIRASADFAALGLPKHCAAFLLASDKAPAQHARHEI